MQRHQLEGRSRNETQDRSAKLTQRERLSRPRHRARPQRRTARSAVVAYFIMGRSENSRNRVFVEDRGRHPHRGVRPVPRWSIPVLIIYHPVRVLGDTTDRHQRRPDRHDLRFPAGGARPSRRPCAPAPSSRTRPTGHPAHQRPGASKDGDYRLSILKSADGDPHPRCQRFFFEYAEPQPGDGPLHPHLSLRRRSRSPPSRESRTPVTVAGDIDAVHRHGRLGEPERREQGLPFRRATSTWQRASCETRIVNKNQLKEDGRAWQRNWILKYGCNPNQKPVAHLYEGRRRAADRGAERQARLYQLSRRVQRLAARAGAESSATGLPGRRRPSSTCSPAGAAVGLPLSETLKQIYFVDDLGALARSRLRVRARPRRGPHVLLRRLGRPLRRLRRRRPPRSSRARCPTASSRPAIPTRRLKS